MSRDRLRTRVEFWFGVVILGRLYTVILCDVPDWLTGSRRVCLGWYNNMPVVIWVELVLYGPIMWFALHQITADVFADEPTTAAEATRHRRRKLFASLAAAMFVYGVGIHATDALEVLARERGETTSGAAAELLYFLDEGLSHYVQYISLFFVVGWFLIFDRIGRTHRVGLAAFLGVVHGVERALGVIEGEKWFMGPIAIVWICAALVARRRRVGNGMLEEFFVRYALSFIVVLPAVEIAYYLRFDGFPPPSKLSDGDYAQLALGAAIAAALGSIVMIAGARRVLGAGRSRTDSPQ